MSEGLGGGVCVTMAEPAMAELNRQNAFSGSSHQRLLSFLWLFDVNRGAVGQGHRGQREVHRGKAEGGSSQEPPASY